MQGLTAKLPQMPASASVVMPFVPERHRELVLGLWRDDAIPLASMKMENDLEHAVGITFTFTSFRYDARRRRICVRRIAEAAGNAAAGELSVRASDAVKRVLGLLCTPVEVMGFDVSDRDVRQIKCYIRTNACDEHFEHDVLCCEATPPDREQAAVAAVMAIVAPDRTEAVLDMLGTMQRTKGALEGIAIDFEGDSCDVKMYFLPRRTGPRGETFTLGQTIEFIDAALERFDLHQHRERAVRLVREMTDLGLASSFQAVEQKADGTYELKIDFNTARSKDRFEHGRVPPEAAVAAIRSAYAAAGLVPDEAALTRLSSRIGGDGIMLDDFTTDFGPERCSGKVYLRAASDVGGGVSAA